VLPGGRRRETEGAGVAHKTVNLEFQTKKQNGTRKIDGHNVEKKEWAEGCVLEQERLGKRDRGQGGERRKGGPRKQKGAKMDGRAIAT